MMIFSELIKKEIAVSLCQLTCFDFDGDDNNNNNKENKKLFNENSFGTATNGDPQNDETTTILKRLPISGHTAKSCFQRSDQQWR